MTFCLVNPPLLVIEIPWEVFWKLLCSVIRTIWVLNLSNKMANISPPPTTCPFCEHPFKKLGNHLAHCKQRDGREYQHLLSTKTAAKKIKSKKQPCSTCQKLFLRLDTHLRLSRSCQKHESPATLEYVQQPLPTLSHEPSSPELPQPPLAPQLAALILPQSKEVWSESDKLLALTVVPAVLAAPTVDAKHQALSQGIYHHFSSTYGCHLPRKKPRWKRWHARCLKKITAQKNEARKQFRQAKASSSSGTVIQELARKFYHLIRLHSAEKILLCSKCRLEALKARRECNRNFWRYASKVLDGEGDSITPDFNAHRAEEFFREVYSAGQQCFSLPE